METLLSTISITPLLCMLRKNHSGMETGIPGPEVRLDVVLRKNHSGMETLHRPSHCESCQSRCVRTIVVWKLCLRRIKIAVFLLRENHSGMETMLAAY